MCFTSLALIGRSQIYHSNRNHRESFHQPKPKNRRVSKAALANAALVLSLKIIEKYSRWGGAASTNKSKEPWVSTFTLSFCGNRCRFGESAVFFSQVHPRIEAWGPPQFQEKRSRSEKAILGALGEFRGILGAALGIGNSILGIRNSILGMASHDLINTKPTILGATLGAIPGIAANPPERFSFAPAFSERFFKNWGGPRAPERQFVQTVLYFPYKISLQQKSACPNSLCANCFYLGGFFLGGLPSLESLRNFLRKA